MHVTFLVLAAYFLAVLGVSSSLPHIDQVDEKLRFDGVGVALAASGLFMFLVGISSISSWGPHRAARHLPVHVLRHLPGAALALLAWWS